MAAIQQNVFVFNASIKDNVSMFRDFPKTELDEAIAHAHLGALIRERGEDYLCGETAAGFPAARNKESPLRGVCSKNPPFCLRMR